MPGTSKEENDATTAADSSSSCSAPAGRVPNLALPTPRSRKTQSKYSTSSYGRNSLYINESGVHIGSAEAAFVPIDPKCLIIDRGRKLGSGACATLLFARSRLDGEPLAIKSVSVNDKHNRTQLLREVRSLYTLECECIVNFFGAYFEDGDICMVIEYMDCGSLRDAFPSQVVPPRVLASVLHQVIFGLSHMYHERMLHRDIKPSNILVNSRGQVKLTDLGLAQKLDVATAASSTYVGTVKYMAPERFNGGEYDCRVDVWSVGLIAIEFATGTFPITTNLQNQLEFIMAVRSFNESPLSVEEHGEKYGVTLHFVDFCAAATAADASRRPFADDLLLHPWLTEQGVEMFENAKCWATVKSYLVARESNDDALADVAAVASTREEATTAIPTATTVSDSGGGGETTSVTTSSSSSSSSSSRSTVPALIDTEGI